MWTEIVVVNQLIGFIVYWIESFLFNSHIATCFWCMKMCIKYESKNRIPMLQMQSCLNTYRLLIREVEIGSNQPASGSQAPTGWCSRLKVPGTQYSVWPQMTHTSLCSHDQKRQKSAFLNMNWELVPKGFITFYMQPIHCSRNSAIGWNIVIGGGGNQRDFLRYEKPKRWGQMCSRRSLSQTEYRTFWLSWDQSSIRYITHTHIDT